MLAFGSSVLHEVGIGRQESSLLPAVTQPLVVDDVAAPRQTAQEPSDEPGMGEWEYGSMGMGLERAETLSVMRWVQS